MHHYRELSEDDPEDTPTVMGPGHIDTNIRQTLQMLWMFMPAGKKNVDAVENEYRRLVDRAIRDLREDAERFGIESGD